MNYSELTKLYPDFKILLQDHADYYIAALKRADIVTDRTLSLLKNFDQSVIPLSKHKMQKMDEILEYFKESNWDLNALPYTVNTDYTNLEFKNFKEDKFYVSVDLKEANWQSFKKSFELQLPDWKEWVEDVFKLSPLLSESKSYRQFIFGNTNPKRLQRMQEKMMGEIVKHLSKYKKHLVGKRSDELIFEFEKSDTPIVMEDFRVDFYQTRATLFTMELKDSCKEKIWLKHSHSNGVITTRMVSVPGNRYFIHLKNLILHEDIEPMDLYFEQNGYLAQWVI